MKQLLSLVFIMTLGACTLSDTYVKPDVGPNNVGIYSKEIKPKGTCDYFLSIKMSDDCSPDKIANEYGIGTITEINTHWIYPIIPLIMFQETTLTGIVYEPTKE